MNSTMGEYLCFVAAGFYRFWSTSHTPTPRVTLVGARYAISAEDAKANNNKAKKIKTNKANNRKKDNKDTTCTMDNPQSAHGDLLEPYEGATKDRLYDA